MLPNKTNVTIGNSLTITHEHISNSTVAGLEYVTNSNADAFNFLRSIAEYYSIRVENKLEQNIEGTLQKHYTWIGRYLPDVIYRAGLIG